MNNIEGMLQAVLNDPEQMKKVMDMAGSLMGSGALSGLAEGEAQPQTAAPSGGGLGGLDLSGLLSGLSKLPGGLAGAAGNFLKNASSSSEDKTQLLEAMKPWLSEKRRGRLDGAMRIAKVMKGAGSAFFGGGGQG